MRSARMLMATAAASAVLALGAPVAHATAGDWDTTDSSYSKEHDKGQDTEKEYGKEHGKEYGKEYGKDSERGMDAGTAKQDEGSWSGKQDEEAWGGSQKKPSGGVHTGGGGLASPAVTAGGLAVLAVAGTGLYAARRRKTAGSVA